MISRNDPCWCGSQKKWKKCHYPQKPAPTFENKKRQYYDQYEIVLKTPEQIEGIRESCKLARSILNQTLAKAHEGCTTEELNDFAHELHRKAGALPAPLGYGSPPFPKSICTSLNDVVCHGIPGPTPLQNGDILNIDVTCILNGYYGDCSAMACIGEISDEKQRVVDAAYESLMESIKILKPGLLLKEIGNVIENVASRYKCSVVNQFVGHGIGLNFHEAPQILHCHNRCNIPLEEGMTFTIEPMINAGVRGCSIDSEDEWTATTLDGLPSAQWEHTLLITGDSCEILTL